MMKMRWNSKTFTSVSSKPVLFFFIRLFFFSFLPVSSNPTVFHFLIKFVFPFPVHFSFHFLTLSSSFSVGWHFIISVFFIFREEKGGIRVKLYPPTLFFSFLTHFPSLFRLNFILTFTASSALCFLTLN